MNFFGGEGYLTPEQRAKVLQHNCEYCSFESNIDLTKPIVVKLFGTMTRITREKFAQDVSQFIAWHVLNVFPDLNGFSGYGHRNWEIKFQIV